MTRRRNEQFVLRLIVIIFFSQRSQTCENYSNLNQRSPAYTFVQLNINNDEIILLLIRLSIMR